MARKESDLLFNFHIESNYDGIRHNLYKSTIASFSDEGRG
jgi:hypothetical protein